MKYILDNRSDSIKSVEEGELNALEIKAKKENIVGAKKVLLVDETLKDVYIKNKVNKKLADIIAKMQLILESDDTGEGTIDIVLDEIERLKGIIINKYRFHLTNEEFKETLKRVMLTEEEFRNKYNAIQIYKEMLMENYDEDLGKGR